MEAAKRLKDTLRQCLEMTMAAPEQMVTADFVTKYGDFEIVKADVADLVAWLESTDDAQAGPGSHTLAKLAKTADQNRLDEMPWLEPSLALVQFMRLVNHESAQAQLAIEEALSGSIQDRPRMRHGKDVEVELDAKEAAEYPLAQATSMFIETVAAAADVGDEFYHTVIELKTQAVIELMLKQPGVSVDDAVSFHFQVATERSRRKKKQRQDVFIVPKDLLNDFTYRAEDIMGIRAAHILRNMYRWNEFFAVINKFIQPFVAQIAPENVPVATVARPSTRQPRETKEESEYSESEVDEPVVVKKQVNKKHVIDVLQEQPIAEKYVEKSVRPEPSKSKVSQELVREIESWPGMTAPEAVSGMTGSRIIKEAPIGMVQMAQRRSEKRPRSAELKREMDEIIETARAHQADDPMNRVMRKFYSKKQVEYEVPGSSDEEEEHVPSRSKRMRFIERQPNARKIEFSQEAEDEECRDDEQERHGIHGFTPGHDDFDDETKEIFRQKINKTPVLHHRNHENMNRVNHITNHLAGSSPLKSRRRRKLWTDDEVRLLEKLIRQYGRNWAQIMRSSMSEPGNVSFEGRSTIDLKDKTRNEIKRRIRHGIPLGGFASAN